MKTFIISAKGIDGQKLFDGEIKIRSDRDLTDPALRELLAIRLSIELAKIGLNIKHDELVKNDWIDIQEDSENRENEIDLETDTEKSNEPPESTDEEVKYMDTPYGDLGTRPPGSIRRY